MSQEASEEAVLTLSSERILKVTLVCSEWGSTKGGVSTINRELAIQLAKQPNVEVSVYLPECSEEEKQVAASHNVELIQAEQMPGYDDPVDWLATLPKGHVVDCVIGHGVHLCKQVQLIQYQHHCKWIQVVDNDPEELGMFKNYADAISKGEKWHQLEMKVCKLSDQVVAVGPRLADAFSGYLHAFGKDQNVLNLTPGIFSEFASVKQASEERRTFSVLVLGHGNSEDLQLNGYDIAAMAIARLKDSSQPYKLKFVGVPSQQEEKVAEMFLQQGIDCSQLVIQNFKESEQLAAQFCEVDLAIMPSRSEGFGLAALEAISAGLPLLVSGNSGLGEALRNVFCGSICVVDSEDPKDWAKAISRVRNKRRDFRLEEIKLIREEYAKTYSWEEQCSLLVQRMRDLATGSFSQSKPTQAENEETLSSFFETLQLLSSIEREPPKRPRRVMVADLEQGSFLQSRRNKAEKRKRQRRLFSSLKKKWEPPKQPRQVMVDYHQQDPPEFTTQPQSLMAREGSDVVFSCKASGNPEPTFSWTKDGTAVNTNANPRVTLSSQNKQLMIANVRKADSGQYRCVANNMIGFPVTSNAATLDVQCSVGVQSSAPHNSLEFFPESSHTQLRSTPEGLDHTVVRILRAKYNRQSFFKPLPWVSLFKLPIEEVYTRLKMLPRQKTDFQLGSNEVAMYDIFNLVKKGRNSMVLVEGSPGTGKTTFCLKVAYDWANGKIPKENHFPVFSVVLLLKCCDIDGDLKTAISKQLLPRDEEYIEKKLMDYIQDVQNQEKTLIILDGLDELPEEAQNHVDRLLCGRIFPRCFILATSRQEMGMKVRQSIVFDVLLQIEGFSRANTFEYIRKHFSYLGPKHLSKGERLISAIQENSFLHALLSNPLNLLLLCVVFEDYDGELPTRRTELYQMIVRCLLRRVCAKHGMQITKDDKALDEQFERSLLALGKLAWTCLLEGRLSFREVELARFEVEHEDLFARKLGLVVMEASLNKINPQNEYYFISRTFQEFLAAVYLAFLLLKKKGSVLKDFKLSFHDDVLVKYRQVFLFLSGILGEEANILFREIHEQLKLEKWDWLCCKQDEATFFTESFNESGNAEQLDMALHSTMFF